MLAQNITCERCGGNDFRVEYGYYFCSECQLQSQDVRVEVMQDYFGVGVQQHQRKHDVPDAARGKEKTAHDKRSVSSWELMNYVLKGLVDELITLGASKRLKIVTLQLWASYLSKLEVAFTSTSDKKKPKFGIYHRKKDVTMFYKSSSHYSLSGYQVKKRKKRPVSDADSDGHSKISIKRRLNRSKKSLAEAEYNESIGDVSLNNSTLDASSMSASLASLRSGNSSIGQEEGMKYAKHGKHAVKKFFNLVESSKDKKKFQSKTMTRNRQSIYNVTMIKMIAILRIALFICGDDIHFGDMLRWADEGNFSLLCPEHLIPPDIFLACGQASLLDKKVNSITFLITTTLEMAEFLGVTKDSIFPQQIIGRLVRRYCKMLNFPGTLAAGIEKLMDLCPPSVFPDCFMNYEGKAMCFILFSLKILIGLDEATEFSYIPRDGGLKWDDWCKDYVRRMADKALHHHPTLIRLYPGSYIGRENALFSFWGESKMSGRLRYEPKRTYNMNRSVKESLQKLLTPLMCSLPEQHKPQDSSGHALAILSQRINNSEQQRKKKIIIITGEPSKMKTTKARSSEQVLVKLLNKRTMESSTTSTSVLVGNDNDEASSHEPLPDFVIWASHLNKPRRNQRTRLSRYEFDEWAANTLPHTFLWLLEELASTIYQFPSMIYGNLIELEIELAPFSKRSRRKRTRIRRSTYEETSS